MEGRSITRLDMVMLACQGLQCSLSLKGRMTSTTIASSEMTKGHKKVAAFLKRRHPNAFSVKALAHELEVSKSTVLRGLAPLMDEGRIERERGTFGYAYRWRDELNFDGSTNARPY